MRMTTWYLVLALAALMATSLRWQAVALVLVFFGLRAVFRGDLLPGAVLMGLSFGPFMAAMDALHGKPFFDQVFVGIFFSAFGVAIDTTLWLIIFRKRITA